MKIIYQNKNKVIKLIDQKMILKQYLNSNSLFLLKNEEKILKIIESLNISPKLYDKNYDEKYLIMSYIKGTKLNEYKFNNFNDKIKIFLKIITSVKKLHGKNIIHCDLKPSNILITKDNEIKIIDYDIATNKKENNNLNYGSIHYCSLEQINKQKITELTDIYSLGIIFYELITGKLPFNGTKEEIIKKKKASLFLKTNNLLLDTIFKRIFDYQDEHYFKNINELENMVKLFKFRKK